jgi:hypothetical protein
VAMVNRYLTQGVLAATVREGSIGSA